MRYLLAMMAVLTTVMVATRVFVSNDAPPEQPIARVEIGLHSGRVTAIATDREGTLAVTVALDKTARVWSLPEGRLLRVLRPPISEGPEGALNAVAISSDGATIAVAGMTGGSWDDGSYSVYVFDRASGRMLHRLGGLPSPVLRLSFTRDDMVLAASLAGPHGLRMWRMEDKTLALYDPDYGGSAPWFAFDAQNRLATVSDDGRVRLYDPQARRAAEVKAPGGQHPHRIAFSPDGKTLAVTYADSARVDILAVSDLRLLHSADIEGLRRPHFDAVAWSGDGQTLVAGGNVLRRWAEAGRGDASDLSLDIEAITQLRLLPRRNLMLVNGESRFVMLADVRDSLYTVPTASIDGPAAPHPLGLSADGTSLEFARDGGTPMRFDVAGRRLEEAETDASRLEPPTPAPEDWPMALDPGESVLATALPDNRTGLLAGTTTRLMRIAPDGAKAWQVEPPGRVVAVNLTRDGRFALAQCEDGTVRWYRWSNGDEVLRLYVHPDGERWVLWTPAGFYDASPGGEDLFGWHLNHGRDEAAEFLPAARFGERRQPELGAKALAEAG